MGISAKVAVAGAAGLFGLVIAAGGAVAASGATLVADAPGIALQVQGIGAAPATQVGTNARLKLLAAAELDGTVETVFPSAAIALGGPATDNAAASGEQTPTNPDSNALPDTPIASESPAPENGQDAGKGNNGNAGNGNTNNGKGNNGVSGNGNTDNGTGNSGNNGNSGNKGNSGSNGNENSGNNGNTGTPGNGNTNNGKGNNGVSGNGNTNNGNGNSGNNGNNGNNGNGKGKG